MQVLKKKREVFIHWQNLPFDIKCIILSNAIVLHEDHTRLRIIKQIKSNGLVCREFYAIYKNKVTLIHLRQRTILPFFSLKEMDGNITGCWRQYMIKDRTQLCSRDGEVLKQYRLIHSTVHYLVVYNADQNLSIVSINKRIISKQEVPIKADEARVLEVCVGLIIHDCGKNILLLKNEELVTIAFPSLSVKVVYQGIIRYINKKMLLMSWNQVLAGGYDILPRYSQSIIGRCMIGHTAPMGTSGPADLFIRERKKVVLSHGRIRIMQYYTLQTMNDDSYCIPWTFDSSAPRSVLVYDYMVTWGDRIIDAFTGDVLYSLPESSEYGLVGIMAKENGIGYYALVH